jgi:hypothetical protein
MLEPDYEAIRRQVARRYRSRFLYVAHVCLYVLVANTMLPMQSGPLFSGIWVTLLVLHTVKMIFDWLAQRATEREYARAREFYGLQQDAGKPKRDAYVRLSDDGEWVDEDELDSYVEPRRAQREQGRARQWQR